jgi:hypothetical protein
MKNAPFHHDGSLHNQSAKYVLEPNVNEIYFSFPIVTQVQGEETSSVEECFLLIFVEKWQSLTWNFHWVFSGAN